MDVLAQGTQIALRRLSPDDLLPFQAYRSDPDVARFQGWDAMTDDEALGFLQAVNQADPLFQPGQWIQIGIDKGGLIGDLGLFLTDDSHSAELGVTLARTAQGQGAAFEACGLAIELIWRETPAQRINIWTDARNLPAQRLIQRLGFERDADVVTEGCVEHAYHLDRAN